MVKVLISIPLLYAILLFVSIRKHESWSTNVFSKILINLMILVCCTGLFGVWFYF